MTRDEVLTEVNKAAELFDGLAMDCCDEPGRVRWESRAIALRVAAEIIRESGWRPIAEVEPGEVVFAGKWNVRDEWQECWPVVADVAVSFGYTHYCPQMKKLAPPAREVEND